MKIITAFCFFLLAFVSSPVSALGGADSAWYLQVNLTEMRETPSGQRLYAWMEREALSDLEDEFGPRALAALERIDVFGVGAAQDPAIVLQGDLSGDLQTSIVERIFSEAPEASWQGRPGGEVLAIPKDSLEWNSDELDTEEINKTLYVAFGDRRQTLITPNEAALDEFLQGGLVNITPQDGLIVIQASRALIQGGLDTGHTAFKNGPWESELFRNIEQFGLVIASAQDDINIRAQAVARTPEMALAIKEIVQGLISLHALSGEQDPEAALLLNNLVVSTADQAVSLDLLVPSEEFVQLID